MEKICSVCKVTKPLSAFYARKQMLDGRKSECKECTLARNSKWRDTNPKAYKESRAKHCATNKKSILEKDKLYRERNKAGISAKRKARYLANPLPHKESVKRSAANNPIRVKAAIQAFHENNPEYRVRYNTQYYKENRAKCILLALKRQAYIKKQSKIVSGLTQAYKTEIDALYDFCQVFAGYEVDHIVPLQGKCVTGLHVPWNMQILTVSENRRKSNTFGIENQSMNVIPSLQDCISKSMLENIL